MNLFILGFGIISSALLALIFIWLFLQEKRKAGKRLAQSGRVLQAVRKINKIILEELDYETVTQKVADVIPNELQFATGVLSILDEQNKKIKRVAASQTKEAEDAIRALKIPFQNIEISVDDPNNLLARAIRERKSFITHDVYDVLGPVLSREEARQIQQIMSTETTVVYPIYMENKPIGAFLASTKKREEELEVYELDIIQEFVSGAAIALQHAILYRNIKEKTEELKIANQKLQQLDKLKDDFVSVASHELRTPMTAIKSYLWMALKRSDITLTEKMTKYLSRAYISTERLINLVNDMLNVSRIEAGKIEIRPEAFSMLELVDEVMGEIGPKAAEKMVHLDFSKNPVPTVFADKDKVHQVLLNLLGNALKFTPNDGSITINFFSDGKVLETSVKDSGVGISREDMSRLFQKFGRLDNSYVAAATSGGTGLGLFISKSLIELMQGKIGVSSEGLGKGTTFTFSLPVATPDILARAATFAKKPIGEVKYLEPVAI